MRSTRASTATSASPSRVVGRPACPYERLFAAPFASYLFDLIQSPDDWGLCARVPATSGLIVGVGDARTADPDTQR